MRKGKACAGGWEGGTVMSEGRVEDSEERVADGRSDAIARLCALPHLHRFPFIVRTHIHSITSNSSSPKSSHTPAQAHYPVNFTVHCQAMIGDLDVIEAERVVSTITKTGGCVIFN
jgi:hypothetical protein